MMECKLKFRVIRDMGAAGVKRRKYAIDLKEGYRYFIGFEEGNLKFSASPQQVCFGYLVLENQFIYFHPEKSTQSQVKIDNESSNKRQLHTGSRIDFLDYQIHILEAPETATSEIESESQGFSSPISKFSSAPTADLNALDDVVQLESSGEKTKVTPEARDPGPDPDELKEEEQQALEQLAKHLIKEESTPKESDSSDEQKIEIENPSLVAPKPKELEKREISLAQYDPNKEKLTMETPLPTASLMIEKSLSVIKTHKQVEFNQRDTKSSTAITLETPDEPKKQVPKKPKSAQKNANIPPPIRGSSGDFTGSTFSKITGFTQRPSLFKAIFVTSMAATFLAVGGFLFHEWVKHGKPHDMAVVFQSIDEQTGLRATARNLLRELLSTPETPLSPAGVSGASQNARSPASVSKENPVLNSAVSVVDRLKMDQFFQASIQGNVALLESLIKSGGIDVNFKSNDGNSALLYSVQGGYLEAVLVLIRSGADVNAQDPSGTTALMWAAHRGNRSLLELLLRSGANKNLKRNDGSRAYDIAAFSKHQAVLDLLK